MVTVHLTLTDLDDAAGVGRLDDDLSAVSGAALVVVHAGGADASAVARVVTATRATPCVLVAEAGDADALADVVDAVVADDDELDAMVAQVARTPLAAASLVLLLRGGSTRTIAEGLVAESTTYSMLQGGPEFAAWRAGRPVRARAEPAEDAVVSERHGDDLHVILNRPHVHNALDARLRDGLADALTVARADPTVARVVVRGNGPSFCSGGDLDTFGSFPDPVTAHGLRLTRSPARLMAALADRTEVRLHGACLGAGIELSAFASRVIARPDARVGLPELGLGLVPGAGGTVSLPRRIGRHRTALLALTATPIDAGTALAWGLVDEISG